MVASASRLGALVTWPTVTTSADLAARYRRVLPSFLTPYYAEPIAIERGSGGSVYDIDGKRYLDFFGGVLTTMIGHDHPAVTAAVQQQACEGDAHLDVVPVGTDDRVRRNGGRRVGDPRRPCVLHAVGQRSQRCRAVVGDLVSQVESDPGDSQQLPRARFQHPGRHVARVVAFDLVDGPPGPVRSRWLPPPLTVPRARRRRLHRGVRRRPRAIARHDVGR